MKTIKDLVEDLNEGKLSEFGSELDRNTTVEKGSIQECRMCGASYKVPEWHFYGLCDDCCFEFKWQEKGCAVYEDGSHFYSCSQWVEFKKNNREAKLKNVGLDINEMLGIPTVGDYK